jgi:hypothetical protein
VAPVAPDPRFRKLSTAATSGTPAASGVLAPGTRVSHSKFGRGTVGEVEPMAGSTNPADLKVTVIFDSPAHGQKTLLSKFAKLELI